MDWISNKTSKSEQKKLFALLNLPADVSQLCENYEQDCFEGILNIGH